MEIKVWVYNVVKDALKYFFLFSFFLGINLGEYYAQKILDQNLTATKCENLNLYENSFCKHNKRIILGLSSEW